MLGKFDFSQNLVAILAILVFSSTAISQQKESSSAVVALAELSLEELAEVKITSIGSGTRKLVSEAPAIATVLTSEEMQSMGATTLEEALDTIPGLHVSNSGQSSAAKYLIRGISTFFNPQTLVLINGIPISSVVRSDRLTRLGVLPIKMISRVEVIRGPGSALYGADAFAGVINVVTKKSTDLKGTELGGQIGSFHTNEVFYLHGAEYEDLKLSLMLDYRETAGHREEISEDAQTRLDRIFGTKASLAPGPVNLMEKDFAAMIDLEKGKWHLRGSYHGKYDVGAGYGISSALDPHGKFDLSRTMVDLSYHDPEISQDWDLTSTATFIHHSQEVTEYLHLFPPGANLGNGVFPKGVWGRPDFFERNTRWDNSAFFTGFEKHRVQVGAGYSRQDLYRVKASPNSTVTFAPRPDPVDLTDTPEIYLPEKAHYSFYAFAQDEWKFAENWEMTAGVRMDRYSDFGNTVNPRLALVWKSSPKLTTKILYGRAFRAPAFAELYAINNPATIGNPNLNPETIEVYELGWTYKANENWQSSFNVFHYDIKDLISFVRDPNGTATAQNFSAQHGNGFELETSLKATRDLFLTAHYSFVDAKDSATRKPVGNYPNDKVYLRGDWSFAENWKWGTQVTWVGPRHREPTDPRNSLEGYTTADLILQRVALFEKYTLTAAIKNAFDDDVKEPSLGPSQTSPAIAIPNDLPQAGRRGFIELRYKF